MTFTIGRASFTNAPSAIRHSGDQVDVNIDILPSSLVEAKVLRQQILGLAGNDDERVVPLTWSDDADYDGFYRVTNVDVEPVQAYLTNNLMRASMSLERVNRGYGAPLHELYAIFAKTNDVEFQTNGDGAVSAIYLPDSFVSQSVTPITTTGRTDSAGVGFVEYRATVDSSTPTADSVAWSHLAAPADFYDAACLVEQQVSSTWYDAIGKQIPAGSTVRVGNGLVRVSVASDGEVTVESWDGSAWRSKLYTITYDTGAGNITSIDTVAVWKNKPDECVVAWRGATDDDGGVTIAARVLRGEVVAEISVSSNSSQSWKLTRSSTEAGTVINDDNAANVAVRASSNDGNGDRYVIISREDVSTGTADTTNGGWTMGATTTNSGIQGGLQSTSAVWGVALEINGSSASAPNDAATLAERFQVYRSVSRSVAA